MGTSHSEISDNGGGALPIQCIADLIHTQGSEPTWIARPREAAIGLEPMEQNHDMSESELTDVFTGQFGQTLDAILHRYGLSAYRLSEDSGIDRPYLSRLLRGMSKAPGRQVALRICYGLARHGVQQIELDRLLIAAGYPPVFLDWKAESVEAGS